MKLGRVLAILSLQQKSFFCHGLLKFTGNLKHQVEEEWYRGTKGRNFTVLDRGIGLFSHTSLTSLSSNKISIVEWPCCALGLSAVLSVGISDMLLHYVSQNTLYLLKNVSIKIPSLPILSWSASSKSSRATKSSSCHGKKSVRMHFSFQISTEKHLDDKVTVGAEQDQIMQTNDFHFPAKNRNKERVKKKKSTWCVN